MRSRLFANLQRNKVKLVIFEALKRDLYKKSLGLESTSEGILPSLSLVRDFRTSLLFLVTPSSSEAEAPRADFYFYMARWISLSLYIL